MIWPIHTYGIHLMLQREIIIFMQLWIMKMMTRLLLIVVVLWQLSIMWCMKMQRIKILLDGKLLMTCQLELKYWMLWIVNMEVAWLNLMELLIWGIHTNFCLKMEMNGITLSIYLFNGIRSFLRIMKFTLVSKRQLEIDLWNILQRMIAWE